MGFMITQSQSKCDECNGRGETIDEKFKCKVCKGKRIVEEEKAFTLEIEKGTPQGHRFVFSGESDEIVSFM